MKNFKFPNKIRVLLEKRPDGGMRAISENLEGLVLSHKNAEAVLRDIPVALGKILSNRLHAEKVIVTLSVDLNTFTDSEKSILEELADSSSNNKCEFLLSA